MKHDEQMVTDFGWVTVRMSGAVLYWAAFVASVWSIGWVGTIAVAVMIIGSTLWNRES